MNLKLDLSIFFNDERKFSLFYINLDYNRTVSNVLSSILETFQINSDPGSEISRGLSEENLALFLGDYFISPNQSASIFKDIQELVKLRYTNFECNSNVISKNVPNGTCETSLYQAYGNEVQPTAVPESSIDYTKCSLNKTHCSTVNEDNFAYNTSSHYQNISNEVVLPECNIEVQKMDDGSDISQNQNTFKNIVSEEILFKETYIDGIDKSSTKLNADHVNVDMRDASNINNADVDENNEPSKKRKRKHNKAIKRLRKLDLTQNAKKRNNSYLETGVTKNNSCHSNEKHKIFNESDEELSSILSESTDSFCVSNSQSASHIAESNSISTPVQNTIEYPSKSSVNSKFKKAKHVSGIENTLWDKKDANIRSSKEYFYKEPLYKNVKFNYEKDSHTSDNHQLESISNTQNLASTFNSNHPNKINPTYICPNRTSIDLEETFVELLNLERYEQVQSYDFERKGVQSSFSNIPENHFALPTSFVARNTTSDYKYKKNKNNHTSTKYDYSDKTLNYFSTDISAKNITKCNDKGEKLVNNLTENFQHPINSTKVSYNPKSNRKPEKKTETRKVYHSIGNLLSSLKSQNTNLNKKENSHVHSPSSNINSLDKQENTSNSQISYEVSSDALNCSSRNTSTTAITTNSPGYLKNFSNLNPNDNVYHSNSNQSSMSVMNTYQSNSNENEVVNSLKKDSKHKSNSQSLETSSNKSNHSISKSESSASLSCGSIPTGSPGDQEFTSSEESDNVYSKNVNSNNSILKSKTDNIHNNFNIISQSQVSNSLKNFQNPNCSSQPLEVGGDILNQSKNGNCNNSRTVPQSSSSESSGSDSSDEDDDSNQMATGKRSDDIQNKDKEASVSKDENIENDSTNGNVKMIFNHERYPITTILPEAGDILALQLQIYDEDTYPIYRPFNVVSVRGNQIALQCIDSEKENPIFTRQWHELKNPRLIYP